MHLLTHLSRLTLLLCLLILAGCNSHSNKNIPQAWLKVGTRVALPDPELSPPLIAQQLLTATIKDQSYALLTVLEAKEGRVTLVGLSTIGIKLFTITYSQNHIETEQNITAKGLPPATQILADIMLSYWPVSAWNPVLPPDWRLVDTANQRILYDDKNKIIIDVLYQSNLTDEHTDSTGRRDPIRVTHHAFGYQINIQDMKTTHSPNLSTKTTMRAKK